MKKQQWMHKLEKYIDKEILVFFIFFLCLFVFFEGTYFILFGLTFRVTKLFFLGLYSFIFSIICSLIKQDMLKHSVVMLLTFGITLLYFGEASYFSIFKSFALWSQILRVDEVAGIKDTLSEFINPQFLILFIPLVALVFYRIFHFIKHRHKVNSIPYSVNYKKKLMYLGASLFTLVIYTMFFVYIQGDPNKAVIKNTTEYIRKYSLLDAFFTNSCEPILKPIFKENNVTPELINREFGIVPDKNVMTNYYQGKNLVFIEGESMAPYAIDPLLTPMLYKLKTEGYYFDNYYSARTNTFASEYAIMNSFYLTPEKEVAGFSSVNSMPGLFKKQGYSTQSFHNFMPEYYKRNERMLELGFDDFYGSNELGIVAEQPDFPSDVDLFNNSFQYIQEQEQFLAYYITVSAHGGYNATDRPRVADNLEFVKQVYPKYDEKVQTYLAAAMLTDQGIATLYQKLCNTGQIENTVIVFVGDHYPYALKGDDIRNTFGGIDYDMDLYRIPMIVWDANKPQQVIHTRMSNVDILPTIANMFNLDLVYGMGKDVFSNQNDEVFIEWYDNRSYSFLTATGGYDDLTGEVMGEISKEELDRLKKLTYRREEWNNSEVLRMLLSN